MQLDRYDYVRIGLWLVQFILLLSMFYLVNKMIIDHSGPEQENVDIFTKLPIFLTGIGLLWSMLLLVFAQMTANLVKD